MAIWCLHFYKNRKPTKSVATVIHSTISFSQVYSETSLDEAVSGYESKNDPSDSGPTSILRISVHTMSHDFEETRWNLGASMWRGGIPQQEWSTPWHMITRIVIKISAMYPKSNKPKNPIQKWHSHEMGTDSGNQETPKTRQRVDATSQGKDVTSTHKVMQGEWAAVWRIQKHCEIYTYIIYIYIISYIYIYIYMYMCVFPI